MSWYQLPNCCVFLILVIFHTVSVLSYCFRAMYYQFVLSFPFKNEFTESTSRFHQISTDPLSLLHSDTPEFQLCKAKLNNIFNGISCLPGTDEKVKSFLWTFPGQPAINIAFQLPSIILLTNKMDLQFYPKGCTEGNLAYMNPRITRLCLVWKKWGWGGGTRGRGRGELPVWVGGEAGL